MSVDEMSYKPRSSLLPQKKLENENNGILDGIIKSSSWKLRPLINLANAKQEGTKVKEHNKTKLVIYSDQ